MTVYLDLWSGEGSPEWPSGGVVRVFGLIHGPPENSSLAALSLGQNQKIPAFYKIHPSIPFGQ